MATKIYLTSAFGLALALFAEGTATTSFDPLAGWGNLTALGIVAVVLIFIVTRLLPDWYSKLIDLSKAFAASLSQANASFIQELDRQRSEHKEQTAALVTELKESRQSTLEVVRKCDNGRKPS